MKVLVIEDNPVDMKLVSLLVTEGGDEALECRCAADALGAVLEHRPDVILLDLNLPDVDGLDLLRLLQTRPDTREIPVVAVTAYCHRYEARSILAAGCWMCLAKPIDTRVLVEQLRAAAGSRVRGLP